MKHTKHHEDIAERVQHAKKKAVGHAIPAGLSVVEQDFLESIASFEELHDGWLSPETWEIFTGRPRKPIREIIEEE